jgi:hypothetical protein
MAARLVLAAASLIAHNIPGAGKFHFSQELRFPNEGLVSHCRSRAR